MSTSSEPIAARVTGGTRSLRGSVGSSISEAVSPHQSLRQILAPLSLPTSLTIRQLCDLKVELDHECLRHATDAFLDPGWDATSEVDSLVELAIFLSGSLSQCGHPGTFLFQEIQLRALVSVLALLQHNGVHTLDPDVWDQLKLKNISNRFQKITFQLKPESTLAEKIRYAPNLYLIQLASQYVSYIRRGDSPWPSIFGPAVNIFFGGVAIAGQQYNHFRDIIEGCGKFAAIWQKSQTKYQSLCAVQEYTRLATGLSRASSGLDSPEEFRSAAAMIVSPLIERIDGILALENAEFLPKLARRWHKALATIHRGPPDLDYSYYYYGLLDCLSQLAMLSDHTVLGDNILEKMRYLIFESVVPEFRWKAIEVLLSCQSTRLQQTQLLGREIETRSLTEARETVLQEIQIIRSHLDQDEEYSLRLCTDQPITHLSTPESSPDFRNSTYISPGPSRTSWQEQPLMRSKFKASAIFSVQIPRKILGNSFHSAGLSGDCEQAFFYNDSEVSVFRLGNITTHTTFLNFPKTLTKPYKDGERIRNVALSCRFFIIVTNKRLLIIRVNDDALTEAIPHDGWDPSGLSCHESVTHLVILLGQCQRDKTGKHQSQIKVSSYVIGGQFQRTSTSTVQIPAHDYPNRLSLDLDGQVITCITRIQNKVLVWRLDEQFKPSASPFEFSKNRYTTEGIGTGITSASTYRSSSDRAYVLCTTSPSTERWRNEGEWSFILPHPSPKTSTLEPPRSVIHNFEQLRYHRALVAGAVSTTHNIFAVLEDCGRISILALDAHEQGGIHSPQADADILSVSLSKQDRPSMSCLVFDPSGSRLFAVDPKGKIVVAEFEKA